MARKSKKQRSKAAKFSRIAHIVLICMIVLSGTYLLYSLNKIERENRYEPVAVDTVSM